MISAKVFSSSSPQELEKEIMEFVEMRFNGADESGQFKILSMTQSESGTNLTTGESRITVTLVYHW